MGFFFIINKYLCQEKTVSYLQKLKGKNKKSLFRVKLFIIYFNIIN